MALNFWKQAFGFKNRAYFENAEIRFACQMCGACCHEWPGVVCIYEREIPALAECLGLSPATFRKRYVRKEEDGELQLVLHPDGACSFYDGEGKCLVHDAKPILCRNFPIWKEVVSSKGAYDRFVALCPGLGEGELIPLEEILRRLDENNGG